MTSNDRREKTRKRCENLGKSQVREKLKIPGFFNYLTEPMAEEWLREQDEVRKESNRTEELAVAKEANRISNEAKESSKFSNKIALAALFFSLLALAISILKP